MVLCLRRVPVDDPDFLSLVKSLSEMLSELNGEMDSYYSSFNTASSLTKAVVAYLDDDAVGCGGLRATHDGAVEIKRMFVSPNARGTGIGRMILQELENMAQEDGYERAVLETSKRLTNANHLYARSGYSVIPNYGPYVGLEDSVCMEKALPASIAS